MRLFLQQGHLIDRNTETALVMRGGKKTITDSMGNLAQETDTLIDDEVTRDPSGTHSTYMREASQEGFLDRQRFPWFQLVTSNFAKMPSITSVRGRWERFSPLAHLKMHSVLAIKQHSSVMFSMLRSPRSLSFSFVK